jgi:hypothetical protein
MKPTQGTTLTKGHSNGVKEFGMGRHGFGRSRWDKQNKQVPSQISKLEKFVGNFHSVKFSQLEDFLVSEGYITNG